VLSNEGNQLGFGTMSQLIGELPIHKEVVIVQLNSPNLAQIDILRSIEGISFIIEERAGEKYRIFTKIDLNQIIPIIFKYIGTNIYNIGKESPNLIDYVYYKQFKLQS
jgi:hypothetical protein